MRIDPDIYQRTLPYPYASQDNILEENFAKALQEEILGIPEEAWDRYHNPFEDKWTLRDKYAFPPHLSTLFDELQKEEFVNELPTIVGIPLFIDPTRNFWGVHKYNHGDKLDIHVDAGLHPTTKQKKQVTFGMYLSLNWKEEYGCQLEIWRGDSATSNNVTLLERVASIAPIFNRMIMFTCNDYSWHGNPEPASCPEDSRRIFITISYLSENYGDDNKRQKAYFVARPGDAEDVEKNKLRLIRADPALYKSAYRT